MQYSLFLLTPEMNPRDLGEEAMQAGREAFDAYAKELDAAGILVSADMLQPSIATTTVAVRGDDVTIDGAPRSDAQERLMGTFVIEVADREAAIDWAKKCPAAQWGTIEIRPSALVFADGAWRITAA